MPLYEYRCEKCGELFEVRQNFADEPVRTHEKCGGPVERLISAPMFNFKGSGWYVNDYAKAGKSGANGDSGAKSDSSEKSEAKKEAAPKAAADKSSSTTETKAAPSPSVPTSETK